MSSALLAFTMFVLGSFAVVTPAFAVDTPQTRAPGPAIHQATPPPMIVRRGDLLSVRIHNVPWDIVAQEIERQTGIVVRIQGHLAGTLTQEFEGLPLEEGMRRLFRDTNYLFFYAAPRGPLAHRLARVWVLPKDESTTADTPPGSASVEGVAIEQRESAGPIREATEEGVAQADAELAPAQGDLEARLTELSTLADEDNTEALEQAVFGPDQILQLAALDLLAARDPREAVTLLRSATKSEQLDERLQALTLLHQTGYADEQTIVSALTEALADEAAYVRGYAIQALAERGGAEALRPLHNVLHDPDATIRMLVIAYVSPTEQGVRLLREALSDEDASLRSAAAAKLADAAAAGQ